MTTHTQVAAAPTATGPSKASCIATAIVRVLYGLAFSVFGLNAFLNFIPPPDKPMAPGATAFFTALVGTGYMIKLIGAAELLGGILLVVNRFVPLALLVLAPLLVNIVAFHLFLERSGLGVALVFVAIELYLAWVHRAAWRPLFQSRSPVQ
jgi:uncharacterized membrane protein YphA (DoxX/SURF4 family)